MIISGSHPPETSQMAWSDNSHLEQTTLKYGKYRVWTGQISCHPASM
jgi:hypothetical protein